MLSTLPGGVWEGQTRDRWSAISSPHQNLSIAGNATSHDPALSAVIKGRAYLRSLAALRAPTQADIIDECVNQHRPLGVARTPPHNPGG